MNTRFYRWRSAARTLVIAAVLATAAGVPVACGDDDDDGGGGGEGPLKVGVLVPLTGPWAQLGKDQVDGIKLSLKENPKPGGREVELVVEDTGGDPQDALTKTRKLLRQDDVDMIMGVISSTELNAVADPILAEDVPLVVTNAGLDAFTEERNENGFRFADNNNQLDRAIAWYAYEELGHRNAAIMHSDYTGGAEHSAAFTELFERLGGNVGKVIKPPVGTTDFGTFISQVPEDADALYIFIPGADAVRFWKQAKQFGLTQRVPVIGTGYVADDLVLQAVGDAADGFTGTLNWVNTLDNEENQQFVKAYEQAAGRLPTVYSEKAYTAMQGVASALESSGGELGEQFTEALGDVSFDSPRGPVRLDENHQAVITVYAYELRDGKPVVLDRIPDVGRDWQPEE